MTAEEIRRKILEAVSKNGGHLASSLGAVEIAMALHDVFDAKKDRIVWDVGHQAYAWKILTDRADRFDTLRTMGGISGFPNPAESPCDAAVAGHAGVAISTAVGFAAARDLLRGCAVYGGQVKVEGEGEQWTNSVSEDGEQVVAVVGDGAIANGTSFEALNNCAAATKKVIVVLNDNEMSISRPVGSMARFFGRLITGVRYNRVKKAAEKAGHALKLTFLRGPYHSIESRIKSLFLGNRFFEQFGLRYIGPIDGHDLAALKAAFTVARDEDRSVLVHVVTKKGKGYAPAEKHPTQWHGVGPFAYGEGKEEGRSKSEEVRSWSDAFGSALVARARKDERIVALTAGMTDGTGLTDFAKEFPKRFFDVGIAEGHMTAFAAGLAAGGMKPVIAVYSTFLQRAVDEVMHDVCLSNLPVVFCVDRAGVVGSDGATHQGVFDIAMLRCLPNLTIAQPKDADDLAALLDEALKRNGPTVIRYPRGCVKKVKVDGEGEQWTDKHSSVHLGSSPSPKTAIWATGDWCGKAQAVAEKVGGVAVHARYLKPFDVALLAEQRKQGMKIVSLENGSVAGGFGEAIGADVKFGWPDEFIPHGTQAQLEKRYGLDVDAIVAKLKGQGERGEVNSGISPTF